MRKINSLFMPFAILTTILSLPGIAGAQLVLEEIVVTAQKRAENLQEVAIGISALSNESLEKANIKTMEELGHAVSGVNILVPGAYMTPVIRGLGTIQVGAAVYMGSTIYVDGVYQPRSYGNNFSTDTAESIQILKGPQGALYGRNSTGGAIVVETRKPKPGEELTGSVKAGYGKFDALELSGWFSTGLTDNTAIMLQTYYNDRDGWHDYAPAPASANRIRDDFGWHEDFGVTGKFIFEQDNVSLLLSGNYTEQDIGSNSFDNIGDQEFPSAAQVSQISPPLAPLAPLFEANNLSSTQILMTSLMLAPPPFGIGLGGFLPLGDANTPFSIIGIASGITNSPEFGTMNANLINSCEIGPPATAGNIDLSCEAGSGYQKSESISVSGTLEISFDRFDLVSITSYQEIEQASAADVADIDSTSPGAQVLAGFGLANLGLGFAGEFEVDNIQEELRLVSNDTWDWEWIVGANYFKETSDFHAVDGNAFGGFSLSTRTDWENTSWSIFAQITYPITDNLGVTLGGRYLRDDLELNDNIDLTNPFTNPALTAFGIGSAGNLEREDSHATYTARLEYKTDDWMIYGGVSTGFKSAALNADGPSFGVAEPEEIDSYEIGWKSQWLGGRLQFNGAVYYYDYTNPHISFVDNANGAQVLLNVPGGDLYGADLDFVGVIGENISWYTGMTILDSEYDADTSFFNAGVGLTSIHATGGKDFAGASPFTLTAGLDYRAPLATVGELFITPSIRHSSGAWYDAENRIGTGGTDDGAFTTVNLNMQYKPNNGNWKVSFCAKNLFDEEYYKSGLQVNGFFLTGTPGDPRTFGGTVSYDF